MQIDYDIFIIRAAREYVLVTETYEVHKTEEVARILKEKFLKLKHAVYAEQDGLNPMHYPTE